MAERWGVGAIAAGADNHVWSYDFVNAMTHVWRTLCLFVLIDEWTRECLQQQLDVDEGHSERTGKDN